MFAFSFFRPFVAVICLMVWFAGAARAELAISIASGTVSPGGSLTLDIGLESTTPPQDLADFELILQITPLTPNGTSLQFVDPQSEAFLDNADYIFAATSEANAFDDTAVFGLTPTEITIADISADAFGDFVDVPVTFGHLLATVDVSHVLGTVSPMDAAGSQFSVSLAPFSFFGNAAGDAVEFDATPGVITVDAVAIPEPGSVALLSALVVGGSLRRRRRQS